MFKHRCTILIIISLVLLSACAEKESKPVDFTLNEVVLETGLELDEEMKILKPERVFKANTDIYFYYQNEVPFGDDQVIVKLVDLSDERVLANSTYDPDPGDETIKDIVWFGSPGRYKIVVTVNDIVKAIREITVE